MFCWLPGLVVCWLTCRIDYLADLLTYWCSVDVPDWLSGWLVDILVVGWLAGLTVWLTCWHIGVLLTSRIDGLADLLPYWCFADFPDWLSGWLVDILVVVWQPGLTVWLCGYHIGDWLITRHLDQSEACDIWYLVREYGPSFVSVTLIPCVALLAPYSHSYTYRAYFWQGNLG